MKLIEIEKKLRSGNIKIFTRLEFRRLLNATPIAAQKLLERYTKKGFFIRLKGGLYAMRLNFPPMYLIANSLYRPSYISFETALSYYHVIPETVYSVTSATTKTTREFAVEERHFDYRKIKRTAFTGYHAMDYGGDKVLIADKEKTIADYLYFVYLKKMSFNDRFDCGKIDRQKLFRYVKLFGRPGFKEWVKDVIGRKPEITIY